MYNGTSWLPPENTAWGVAALNKRTTTVTVGTSEVVTIAGSSFTAVANRYYKLTYYEPDLFGSGKEIIGRIRLTNISGTEQAAFFLDLSATSENTNFIQVSIKTFSAGSMNLVATAVSNGASVDFQAGGGREAFLLVEDVGPA